MGRPGHARSGIKLSWLVAGVVGAACAADDLDVGRHGAALEVGAEAPIEPPESGFAAGMQSDARPLRAGDHYLVAWRDDRESWPSTAPVLPDLFGARVADDGTVLDPVGFPITHQTAGSLINVSSACSDDGVCLFVTGSFNGVPTRGVRVMGGQVLDPEPFLITSGAAPDGGAGAAWDGERFRVLYFQGGALMNTGVGRDGTVGAPMDVEFQLYGNAPGIACGGARCLVVGMVGPPSSPVIQGRLLDRDGPVGEPFLIGDRFRMFAGAPFWDGHRYWVPLVERPNSFDQERISLVRVTADGDVLDPGGIEIIAAPPLMSALLGGIARSGDGVVVSWQRNISYPFSQSARVTRVRGDGAVVDPDGVEIGSPPIFAPRLACGPDVCLAATVETFGRESSARGYFLDGASLVDPAGFDISTAPPGQTEPAATCQAGRYAAVWRDSRPAAGPQDVQSIHGVIFPPAMDSVIPFRTSVIPGTPNWRCTEQRDPRIAATATSVLVAWHEECRPAVNDDVFAQAFGLDGQPLGPGLDPGNRDARDLHPWVVSTGSEYLMLWEYEEPNPPRSIQMRRYDAAGRPLSARAVFNANGVSPVATFDGTNYLIVWQRGPTVRETRPNLFAARMAPDGTVLDADIPIATNPSMAEDAQSVACGGGVCLIVWRAGAAQLRALRLGLDGTVLDAQPLLVPVDGPVPTTSVTFDGEDFVLVWQTETGELRAAQVTPAGQLRPPGAIVIAAADPTARHPVVASTGAGHRIAIYDRYVAAPDVRMRRVVRRLLGPLIPAIGAQTE